MKQIIFLFIVLFTLSNQSDINAARSKRVQYCSKQILLTESIQSYEDSCHKQINCVRQQHGLQPLKWWGELADCAREHSQNMANGLTEFGHDGFDDRFKMMRKQASLSSFGENVAYCYNYDNPVQISVEGWMNSKGHRDNILHDYEETGIGVAISEEGKFYITQLFAKRRCSNRSRTR